MTVCGIDFSSRAVHLVLLDDEGDAARETPILLLHGATPFERARSLRDVFPTRSWFEERGVYLIGIEDPHSRANHTAKALGLAAGAIAALLPRELTVIQTPPSEWHRVFAGHASASKEWVEAVARTRWHGAPDDADDNVFDAYGIAWAVRRINDEAVAKAIA